MMRPEGFGFGAGGGGGQPATALEARDHTGDLAMADAESAAIDMHEHAKDII